MSRHLLPAPDGVDVVVGWDAPLATFFAQAFRDAADPDGEREELLWIGTRYGEIADVDQLLARVAPFASDTPIVRAALLADREREGTRPKAEWVR